MKISFSLLLVLLVSLGHCHRPLSRPQPRLCQNRGRDFYFQGHRYVFSWRHQTTNVDWLDSRNYCRDRCMDSLAVESEAEWNALTSALREDPQFSGQMAQTGIWTSGRLCDFDGCERSRHVKPVHVKGWFWSANNQKMSPTTCINGNPGCFHAWSDSGRYGFPQPDNREFRERGLPGNEGCLALKAMDGAHEELEWHDKACFHKMVVICEDSETLLNYARRRWRNIFIP